MKFLTPAVMISIIALAFSILSLAHSQGWLH